MGLDDFFRESAELRSAPLTPEAIIEADDDHLDSWVWTRMLAFVNPGIPENLANWPRGVQAYMATRLFEWESGNGGLHQYFFNYPNPGLLAVVLDGYSALGLDEVRRVVEEVVAPVAANEEAWRESLRDGRIETFFESYSESQLPEYDERIGHHDVERIRYVRANPLQFCV